MATRPHYQSIRWNTKCKHKCACGVEMIGNEPDLESWLFQHLTMSKIHARWLEEWEMMKLKADVELGEVWDM